MRSRTRSAVQYVISGSARRLGKTPLGPLVLRAPRLLPPGPLRSWLYRSFSWPLAKRLKLEAELSVAGGNTIVIRTDDVIGRVLAVSGVWEPNVTAAFQRHLAQGDVCVDIGAHVGYFTLLASKLVGAEGHVYAFEPSPVNFRALRANLERNGAVNVTAFEVAAGEAVGTAVLHEGPGTNTGRATLNPVRAGSNVGERPQVVVDIRPVLTTIPAEDLTRVRVIKIDVEGHELEVLRSLEPILGYGGRLAVFLEFTPDWSDELDAAHYIEELARRHRLRLQQLGNGTSGDFFPLKLHEPTDLDSIPLEQCDLLLTRG